MNLLKATFYSALFTGSMVATDIYMGENKLNDRYKIQYSWIGSDNVTGTSLISGESTKIPRSKLLLSKIYVDDMLEHRTIDGFFMDYSYRTKL